MMHWRRWVGLCMMHWWRRVGRCMTGFLTAIIISSVLAMVVLLVHGMVSVSGPVITIPAATTSIKDETGGEGSGSSPAMDHEPILLIQPSLGQSDTWEELGTEVKISPFVVGKLEVETSDLIVFHRFYPIDRGERAFIGSTNVADRPGNLDDTSNV